jgi:hypothetical protein
MLSWRTKLENFFEMSGKKEKEKGGKKTCVVVLEMRT